MAMEENDGNANSTIIPFHSFITKPNDQNSSPTSYELSTTIDIECPPSTTSPTSPSTAVVNDPRNPSFRLQNSSNPELELTYHHAPNSNQNHSHRIPCSINKLFQKQDLGKHILVFTVPLVTALISLYKGDLTSPFASLILLLLSFGLAATWNGILLSDMYPGASIVAQHLGVASIFLALFVLVGELLPPALAWIPWLCFAFCLVPFILSVCFRTA